MAIDKDRLGLIGEGLAYKYLVRRGYVILERNFSSPLGEIDIIAVDNGALVFVEVKTRLRDTYGLPEEYVDAKKQSKMARLAQCYIKYKALYDRPVRFDVVSVMPKNRFWRKKITLIKDAFYIE